MEEAASEVTEELSGLPTNLSSEGVSESQRSPGNQMQEHVSSSTNGISRPTQSCDQSRDVGVVESCVTMGSKSKPTSKKKSDSKQKE